MLTPVWFLLACAAPAASDAPPLVRVVEGNRASQEVIHTLYARVRLSYPDRSIPQGVKAPDPCQGGEYWRRAGTVRVREVFPAMVNEHLLTDSQSRLISKHYSGNQLTEVGTNLRGRAQTALLVDVWELGLLSFNRVALYDHLAKVADQATVKEVLVNGHPSIHISHPSGQNECSFWIDPAVNHLARKSAVRLAGGTVLETEVQEFQEHLPGVFFPKRIVRKYQPGPGAKERAWRIDVLFDTVQVNKPINGDVFRLKYPRDVVLADEIQGLRYKVDEDGNRIGAASPLVSAVPNAPDHPAQSQTPLDAEGGSGIPWRWVVPSVLLVAAALFFVIRGR